MKKQPQKRQKNITNNRQNSGSARRSSVRQNIGFRVPFEKPILLWLLVIAIATFAVYVPAIDNGLTNWDDDVYVTDNLYIMKFNKETVKAYFSMPFVSNYHPITMLTYAMDYQLSEKFNQFDSSGLRPTIFHTTNVVFHTLNTILVFIFVYLLIGSMEARRKQEPGERSWKVELAVLASALFGLHTLHVESVAWVAERKDVLYTFFNLLSFIFYIRYLNRNSIVQLIVAVLFFSCALLSKAMAVSLTVTLFALDYLLGRKLLSKQVLLEKLPFFAMSLIFGIVAVNAQRASGAMADPDKVVYSLFERILFASYGFTQYLVKLIVPVKLSAFYSYPDKPIAAYFYAAPLVPLAFVGAFYLAIKRNLKLVAFGMMFFVFNIALVLQLIPVGNAIMADRYSYVPSIGIFILIVVGYQQLAKLQPKLLMPLRGILVLYMVVLSFLTYLRTDVWENSLTMWNDVLEQFQNVPAAWNNRGNAQKDLNMFEEAIKDYNEAIRLKPDHYKAFNNRGIAKKNIGVRTNNVALIQEAIGDYDKAIAINPTYDDAFSNRGNAKRLLRDFDGALKDYDRSIELKPMFAQAYSNRGATRIDKKDFEGAIKDLKMAIQLRPRFVEAYYNMANAYFSMADYASAIEQYKLALQLRPNYSEAYSNMAGAYFQMGDFNNAIASYGNAIAIDPNKAETYVNRGGTVYNLANTLKEKEPAKAKQYYQNAMTDLDKCLQLDKNNQKAAYIKNMCLQQMNAL